MKLPFEARGLLGPGLALVVGLPPSFRLQDEIEAADSIKLATAFAHWSGWNHLRPHINKSAGRRMDSSLDILALWEAVIQPLPRDARRPGVQIEGMGTT